MLTQGATGEEELIWKMKEFPQLSYTTKYDYYLHH
jgi:hypothetical protein